MAVLVVDNPDDTVPLAEALLEGGVDIVELALRTPAAMTAMSILKARAPGILVGIGTVITPCQVREIAEGGAAFAVSPGTNAAVLREAARLGLPFAPGVCTPSDIELAIDHGCHMLKYFPAESSGGLAHLKKVAEPYLHLGLKFIPLGGLTAQSLEVYLREPLIAAVGGSWLAPRPLILKKEWAEITRRCRETVQTIRKIKQTQNSEKLNA